MVRGKARYYKNRPKAIPVPEPRFKELDELELTMEEISPEEEKAIKQESMVLHEEILKEPIPIVFKKAIEDEMGDILPSNTSTTETVVPANTELTTSAVKPTGNEQTSDSFGKPINNKRKKKQQ